jgi:ribonuclease T2
MDDGIGRRSVRRGALARIGVPAWMGVPGIALFLALALAGVASARHHGGGGDAGTSGQFDYYLLALSWSPTYCLTHPNQTECDVRGYGFVLHGLWPQYSAGGWPERCRTAEVLDEEALRFARRIYPAPQLAVHEWTQHGVCSGLDARAYFEAADRARTAVRIPPWLEAPPRAQSVRPAAVVEALLERNPGLHARGVVVACERGELAEVRLCLDRDLKSVDCGRGVHSNCPAGGIDVPASR